MSFDQYDIFFSGQLIEGSDPATARKKLAALFKLPPERVEHLFSGKPVAVKRGVDMDRAVKYRTAFRDAGALVDIKPTAVSAPTATASIPDVEQPVSSVPTQEPTGSESGLTLNPANTGSLEDCTLEVIPTPIPDISQMSMAEVGVTLDDSEPPPPLDIDTSAITLSPEDEENGIFGKLT